jgi:hypothetical protein
MATKTGKLRHTHKYHKLDDNLWHCAHPDCSHYMPKNVASSMPGKRSICWRCEKEFILTPVNMREEQPQCDYCLNPELSKIEDYLDDFDSAIPSSMKNHG